MKSVIKTYKLTIIGVILGAMGGFFYWKYVGCLTGTCPLKSNPYFSVIYWGIGGGFFLSLFNKNTPSAKQ